MSEEKPSDGRSEEELLRGYADDTVDWDELSEELQEKVLDGNIEMPVEKQEEPEKPEEVNVEQTAKEGEPKAEEEEAPTEPAPKQESESEPKTEDKEEGKTGGKSPEELRELALDRANALNTLKQQQSSHERRLVTDPKYREEWFKERKVDLNQKTSNDVWDEDYHRGNEQTLKSMQERIDKFEAQQAQDQLYNSLEVFAKSSNLGMTLPVREVDNIVKAIAPPTGENPSVEDLVKNGVPKVDAEAYYDILGAYQKQQTMGYPTIESAYIDHLRMTGRDPFSAKKQVEEVQVTPGFDTTTESQANKKALEEAANRPVTMPVASDAGNKTGSMTEQQMLDWVLAHPDPDRYSEDELRVWQSIETRLDT